MYCDGQSANNDGNEAVTQSAYKSVCQADNQTTDI